MATNGIQQFSFGEGDAGIGGKLKPFKADASRSYRLSFIWFRGLEEGKPDLDAPAPQFAGASTNFIPSVGYIINKGPEYSKLAGGDPPRMRIASIIVVWPTDKEGNINREAMGRNETEILPWVISGDKFTALKKINKEFPFGSHDFTVTCSDATYQKMTFTPCRDSFLRALVNNPKAEAIVAEMVAKAVAIAGTISDYVGREMTVQAIREKLTGGGGGGGTAAVETMATGDIDAMVDGMLDA
jgi:hypothetical protein